MKNKKGFTLVELLAVIAILAIIVIIALPNVINMYNKAQKETFLTEAKKVYNESEKKYLSNAISGKKTKVINSEDSSKLDMTGEKLQYCIILGNDGKVTNMKVSNGKWIASLNEGKSVEDLTIEDLEDGNLDGYECGYKKPKSFKDDSWDTIVEAVRSGNDGSYNVGDTKEVDLGDLGKHTIRITNKSTPSECSTEGFSQTACGFVLEFEKIVMRGDISLVSSKTTNKGGWPAASAYTTLNDTIYKSLPEDLKNNVIETRVISGHGSEDTDNFISIDKLYLLSPKEIYSDWSSTDDTAKDLTRQLDYYKEKGVTTSNYSAAIKKYNTNNYNWWTRTPVSSDAYFNVSTSGNFASTMVTHNNIGLSPAFRIG